MDENKEKHLSLKELKKNIRHALQKSGALNTVKAQIRREFVEGFKDFSQQSKHNYNYKLWDRILLSVIYHHFKHLKLEHTLSVFVAESGFDSRALIDVMDIPMSLNFGTESKIFRILQEDRNEIGRYLDDEDGIAEYDNIKQKSKSVLELLMNECCANSRKLCTETSCQTDAAGPSVRETLDQQVRELHLSYTTRRETERLLPNKTIEERMIAFQRECEERFRKEYESQLDQVRNVELARVRAEEANQRRIEVDLARKELEANYQARLQAQMDREAESVRVAADKARQSSLLEYEARQRMQRELDDLRIREENSRRKIELETQGIRLLESRVKESQVALESREREVSRQEKELAIKANEILTQARDEASRAAERELDSFLRDKATLMLERKRFEEEKESETSRQMALAEMRNKFREMQDIIDSKDGEIAQLKSALNRMKHATSNENSNVVKLLDECGIYDDETNNDVSSKLDSFILLIKKNAELETCKSQMSLQISSTQKELEYERKRSGDLNNKLLSRERELQLVADSNAEKDKANAKLLDDNEKLKRMLANVRRARMALSEESKELEKLVGEQRAIIVQMRKTQSRDAAVNSIRFTGMGGNVGAPRVVFEKENNMFENNRNQKQVAVYPSKNYHKMFELPSSSPAHTEKLQSSNEHLTHLDAELAALKARELEDAKRQVLAHERQQELDQQLEIFKQREIDDIKQRHLDLEKQKKLQIEREAANLREIEEARRRLEVSNRHDQPNSVYGMESPVTDGSNYSRSIVGVELEELKDKQVKVDTKHIAADLSRTTSAEVDMHELADYQCEEIDRQREADEKRLQQEEFDKQRLADEARRRQDEIDRQRLLDEDKRKLEELERQQRVEEEQRKQAEMERQRRVEDEQQRLAEMERQRLAEDEQRKQAEMERERRAEEQRKEDEAKRERIKQQELKEQEEKEAREYKEKQKQELIDNEKLEKEKLENEARERAIKEQEKREIEEQRLNEAAEEEKRKKELEEQKKREDAEYVQSARARVLARRQQQKLRQEREETPPIAKQEESVIHRDPDSPNNTLSDTDLRSFDGDDSSDYDWS